MNFLLKVIVVLSTIFAVWQVLIHFGVFESVAGIKQLNTDIEEERALNKKRKREKEKLSFYFHLTDYFRGLFLSDFNFNSHKYIIERLEIKSKVLDRSLTPEEYRGKYIFRLIIAVLCIPLGFIFKPMWVVSALGVLNFITYKKFAVQKIRDEDDIIDVYFINLYLLMYSKLRMGSKARLQKVVESYIDTLNVSASSDMKEVMLKFSRYLLNNLTMFEESMAIPKLKLRYKSATIVNFCNVATQALEGIDNSDTLLSFKQELIRRKTDTVKKNADALCRKGEKAVYLIYIILFIFIAVGWYSKLPKGFF